MFRIMFRLFVGIYRARLGTEALNYDQLTELSLSPTFRNVRFSFFNWFASFQSRWCDRIEAWRQTVAVYVHILFKSRRSHWLSVGVWHNCRVWCCLARLVMVFSRL